MTRWKVLSVLAFACAPTLAFAQNDFSNDSSDDFANDPSPADVYLDPYDQGDEIVVVGERRRGTVYGDIEPDITLDAADVLAYGASSIGELLEVLGPQTSSGRGGRPAILLNGRRIGSFREIRQMPPEAIDRVEVLPEAAALKYGFRADQRVVNFVLRERFRALTSEIELEGASEGGRIAGELEANRLRLRGDTRTSIDLTYRRDTKLTEAERGLVGRAGLREEVGNVTALNVGDEIDPALSLLAGETVTVAGAPSGAASGPVGLGAFAPNAANYTDEGAFRTLLPQQDALSLSASYSDIILGNIQATATAALDYTHSEAHLGLAGATLDLPDASPFSPFASDVAVERLFFSPGALQRVSDGWQGTAAFVLNSEPSDWSWSVNGQYVRSDNATETERGVNFADFQAAIDAGVANPFGPVSASEIAIQRERAIAVSNAGLFEAVFYGNLLTLPAGDLSTTVKIGAELTRQNSTSDTIAGFTRTRIGRDSANGQINVDVPLMAEGETPAPFGELTLSANGRIDTLSDFNDLHGFGADLVWRPIGDVQLVGSYSRAETAPTMQQLGDPLIRTPNVRVFDFATGQSVDDVTRVTGGDPNLLSEDRRVWQVNLRVKPFGDDDFSVTASYTDQYTDNAITAFPSLTPDIEAAFADRFIRNDAGRLIEIDARAVNYAQTARREFRYGAFWSTSLDVEPPSLTEEEQAQLREIMTARFRRQRRNENASDGNAQKGENANETSSENARPRGGASGRGRGRRGGRGGRGADGRLMFWANHTVILENSVQIAPGAPVLDLLGGDAVTTAGDTARHQVSFGGRLHRRGFGAGLDFDWRSGTTIDQGASGDLHFSDIGKVNVELRFDPANHPRILIKYPFLLGTRISLEVDNLLNARQEVVDASGATPENFRPEYLDPNGRIIRLEFRKLFF